MGSILVTYFGQRGNFAIKTLRIYGRKHNQLPQFNDPDTLGLLRHYVPVLWTV
jgi:hypothetical protein